MTFRNCLMALALVPAAAFAWPAKDKSASLTDGQLMARIHHINKLEIDAGKMAAKHGTDQAVKDYGKELADDHEKADDQLKTVAKNLKIDMDGQVLPEAVQTEEKNAKSTIDGMTNLTGATFDHTFAQTMETDHKGAIAMLRTAKPSSKDLQTFIDSTVPVLEHHRDLAHKLASVRRAENSMQNDEAQGRTGDDTAKMHREGPAEEKLEKH